MTGSSLLRVRRLLRDGTEWDEGQRNKKHPAQHCPHGWDAFYPIGLAVFLGAIRGQSF